AWSRASRSSGDSRASRAARRRARAGHAEARRRSPRSKRRRGRRNSGRELFESRKDINSRATGGAQGKMRNAGPVDITCAQQLGASPALRLGRAAAPSTGRLVPLVKRTNPLLQNLQTAVVKDR